MVLPILLIFILVLLVFIFWEFSNIISLIFGVPFAKTPREYLRKAFKMVDLRPEEIVYDLGAGDGSALIVAAKDFQAKSLGFEISPWRYLVSKWNLKRAQTNPQARIFFQDFKKVDLNKADVIYLYLMPKVIQKLENTLKNLRRGIRIISFRFPINYLKLLNKEGKIYVYKI